MRLRDTNIRRAKPGPKPIKMYDGEGLYMLISPSGSRLWRMKYRYGGKEKLLSLGKYPEISLKAARDLRYQARKLLDDGQDPSYVKQQRRFNAFQEAENSFKSVALEFLVKKAKVCTEKYVKNMRQRLERNVFPYIGNRPINDIKPSELFSILDRIDNQGKVDTAHRVKQNCGEIFRYAVATCRAEYDPTASLSRTLTPNRPKHLASIIEPKKVGELLRAIDGYKGQFITQCALKLAPLLFVRPGELRHAEWSEIDFEEAEWRIPAGKMKMKAQHIVPLSNQSIAILKELKQSTGNRQYVFPSIQSPKNRPMSENTVNGALRRLGYERDEMTGHGFRSMASTLLNEHGWNRDAIERQLAHAERDSVRAAYNYADYLPERRKMMEWWADYLDRLKAGADIVHLGNING